MSSKAAGKIAQKQRKLSERSLANLKPFPPGKSGNPGGKAKGPTLLSTIRHLLDAQGGADREAAAEAFVKALKSGSHNHAKTLIEQEEGNAGVTGEIVLRVLFEDKPDRAGTDD